MNRSMHLRLLEDPWSCEQARAAIDAVDEAAPCDARALRRHLETCSACHSLAPELLFFLEARPEDESEGLAAPRMALLRGLYLRDRARKFAACAAVLVLLCGLWAVGRAPSESPVTETPEGAEPTATRPLAAEASFGFTSRVVFDQRRRVESRLRQGGEDDGEPRRKRRNMEWKSR